MLLYVIRESFHPEVGKFCAYFTIDSSFIEHAIACRTNLRLREEFFGELYEKNIGNDSEAYDGDRYDIVQSIALQSTRMPDYMLNLEQDSGFYLDNDALRMTNKHWFDTPYVYGVGISKYHALLQITGYEDGWSKSVPSQNQEALDNIDAYKLYSENINWTILPVINGGVRDGGVRFGELVVFGASTGVGKSTLFNQNT